MPFCLNIAQKGVFVFAIELAISVPKLASSISRGENRVMLPDNDKRTSVLWCFLAKFPFFGKKFAT